MTPRNFALLGAAGFVAPRHLRAIRDGGHRLVAAADPSDSVGILDQFGFGVRFFRDADGLARELAERSRRGDGERVHWVSVCTPNHLHAAHVALALRAGADALCEKPLVVDPRELDALARLAEETGGRVATVLQLRLHPAVVALAGHLEADPRRHRVTLRYVTARGPWYFASWKGDEAASGGIAANIGIHLFDLLLWLFGSVEASAVVERAPDRMAGRLRLARADVDWMLSIRPDDLPFAAEPGGRASHRALAVDGAEVELSDGFADLHTRVYETTLAGGGCGIEDARPAIELVDRIRRAPIAAPRAADATAAAATGRAGTEEAT